MEASIFSIVLAAGASRRMMSRRSKLLHRVLGKTIGARALELGQEASTEKTVVVLGHQREMIEPELKPLSSKEKPVTFVRQKEQKGTADAVRTALEALDFEASSNAHVFIMPADAVLLRPETLTAFVDSHLSSKAQMSLISAHLDEPGALGRILRDRAGNVERIVEFKDASEEQRAIREINSGFYLIQAQTLLSLINKIESQNQANEFYLTDLVHLIREQSGLVRALELQDSFEAFGINNQIELSIVTKVLQRRRNYYWMLKGAHLIDPETVWIDDSVELESDVVIHPGVILRGRSRIEFGAEIGAYSILKDSHIKSFATIKPHSSLEGAVVGESSQVGPFARLRTGSVLEKDVKVGNFVEVKNTTLAAGAKASHLTYLGDAQIGEQSNIGAGTITCNYDGFKKLKTTLGKNVFVGSNSSLIAPVEIGDGAIIGAGSAIEGTIRAESIALERSDQKEIEGGAVKFRKKRTEET